MSTLLVDKSSQSAASSTGTYADVADMVDTVVVGSSSSVVLLIATVPMDLVDSGDESATFRFEIAGTQEGPELTFFARDNTDQGCGATLCYAKTGLSGSTKFALQWITSGNAASTDTGRTREFQVIEITDATLLVDKSSVATDVCVSGYTDIVGLTDTQTVASGSILVLLGNVPIIREGGTPNSDTTAYFSFSVAGTREGPELSAMTDAIDFECGQSMMWLADGQSGSTAFALQWDEIKDGPECNTAQTRTFQVIQITANANILTNQTSQAADDLESSYTNVVGLSDTVTVDGTDAILVLAAGVTEDIGDSTDEAGAFRFADGGTGEGPENYVFKDSTDEGCGHSVYYAVTGKSAGSHTFSLQGQNKLNTWTAATDRNRSLAILELTAAAAPMDSSGQLYVAP